MSNGSTPQESLERLLQAEREAKRKHRQAEEAANQQVDEAQAEADSLIEKVRSEAEEEAQAIIDRTTGEADEENRPDEGQAQRAYLTDVETMRRRAEANLDGAVQMLVAWVTGEEV